VLEKQPIERLKQPVVTCFYCMKRGHSVRFCKIRKYFVPKGILKLIPKGCEVSNDKAESKGPTFIRGPNLVAWIYCVVGILREAWSLELSDQAFRRKEVCLELN